MTNDIRVITEDAPQAAYSSLQSYETSMDE